MYERVTKNFNLFFQDICIFFFVIYTFFSAKSKHLKRLDNNPLLIQDLFWAIYRSWNCQKQLKVYDPINYKRLFFQFHKTFQRSAMFLVHGTIAFESYSLINDCVSEQSENHKLMRSNLIVTRKILYYWLVNNPLCN